jgi:SAM-dependent methyltransferase
VRRLCLQPIAPSYAQTSCEPRYSVATSLPPIRSDHEGERTGAHRSPLRRSASGRRGRRSQILEPERRREKAHQPHAEKPSRGNGLALEAMQARARLLIGVEYRSDKLAAALQRLPRATGIRADAGMLPFTDGSVDVVTCLEVLEHLEAPERAVGELARICRGRCVVSVPWEPYFRLGNLCRGKDVRNWGNNREHVQHFRPSTLRHLLGVSFGEAKVYPCFPWIIAVATPATRGEVGDYDPSATRVVSS